MTLQEFVEEYATTDLQIKDLQRVIECGREALIHLSEARSKLVTDNGDILEEGIFDVENGHVAIVGTDRGLSVVFHTRRTP